MSWTVLVWHRIGTGGESSCKLGNELLSGCTAGGLSISAHLHKVSE
jgi:hypothetical protein